MGLIHVQKTQKKINKIKRQKRVITFTVRQNGKREGGREKRPLLRLFFFTEKWVTNDRRLKM